MPSWDVLGLGVPPGDVLSSGVVVFPGDVLRSEEDVGTPGNPCHDPKGPTHITVVSHRPGGLGASPIPRPCHPLTSCGT